MAKRPSFKALQVRQLSRTEAAASSNRVRGELLFRVEQDAAEVGLRDNNQLLQAFGDGRLEVAKTFSTNEIKRRPSLFQSFRIRMSRSVPT